MNKYARAGFVLSSENMKSNTIKLGVDARKLALHALIGSVNSIRKCSRRFNAKEDLIRPFKAETFSRPVV